MQHADNSRVGINQFQDAEPVRDQGLHIQQDPQPGVVDEGDFVQVQHQMRGLNSAFSGRFDQCLFERRRGVAIKGTDYLQTGYPT